MQIEVKWCKSSFEADQAYIKAKNNKAIALTIRPRRKYAEVCFDTFTSDPEICDKLTDEGTETVHGLYNSYLKEMSKRTDRPKHAPDVYVGYGPRTGYLTVLKEDAESFAQRLKKILDNTQYWQTIRESWWKEW